jgi:hypothetical protein
MSLQIGARYSFEELKVQFGNLQRQQSFPQVGRDIVCALLEKRHNPRAPDEVLVGAGPQMLAKARRLAEEGTVIPIFIKKGTNQWEYQGRYHVARMLKEGSPQGMTIWKQRGRQDEPGIVLYLQQDERHVTRYFTERGKARPKPLAGDIDDSKFAEIIVDPPEPTNKDHDSGGRSYGARNVDQAARDAVNRDLGERGEEFVVKYERWRLVKAKRPDLAPQVRRISITEGDGAGYDVLSFDLDAREKYIEVKTTTGGKRTPFIVTLNEVEFSENNPEDFLLYRVIGFDKKPRIYVLEGSLRERCHLEAVQFRARF